MAGLIDVGSTDTATSPHKELVGSLTVALLRRWGWGATIDVWFELS